MIPPRYGVRFLMMFVFLVPCFAQLQVQITQKLPPFEERDGYLLVEAERFYRQENGERRRWYQLPTSLPLPGVPEHETAPAKSASGGVYLHLLPDTRSTSDDFLMSGENFSNQPGRMAVLLYSVRIQNPGRYYVWARAYSTGTEDNRIHVGLNGEWPESGQRMQWCEGKHSWRWESAQRTEANHCGEPGKIYLDIPEAGEHTIMFSMREDGFRLDQWLITTDAEFQRPPDGPVDEP